MITLDNIGLDKIIEIWNIKLDGVGVEDFNFGHGDFISKKIDKVNYEVHTTVQHNPPDGQRTISEIFPEYGEVTDEIRKALETEVQKIDH